MKKKLFGGFTLVELMVVIAIIAILSSIVLANLNTARAKSRDARRISDISQIQLALANYLNKCGTYLTGDSLSGDATVGWGCPTTLLTPGTSVDFSKLVTLGFIGVVPTDPLNTGNFIYGYSSPLVEGISGTLYCLGANLEKPNSNVDLANTCIIANWTANTGTGGYTYRVSKP